MIDQLDSIVKLWNIIVHNEIYDCQLTGSPERTLERRVIQSENDQAYLLEKIAPDNVLTKQCIAGVLDYLAANNCSYIQPCLKTLDNQTIVNYCGDWWELLPYIPGEELDRGEYYKQSWRGEKLAHFFLQLREKSDGIESICQHPIFSVKVFINEFKEKLAQHNPDILKNITEIIDYLADFLSFYDELPLGFCHGDIHPLNIVWGKHDIISVIDWEFHGPRARIFDVANLVGCLAMEDPLALFSDTNTALLSVLREHHYFNALEKQYFLDFILATRFLWLSDWLRRKDSDMINLEQQLMYLLLDNRNRINEQFGI